MPGLKSPANRESILKRREGINRINARADNLEKELGLFIAEFDEALKVELSINAKLYFDQKKIARFQAAEKEIREIINGRFIKRGMAKDIAALKVLLKEMFI